MIKHGMAHTRIYRVWLNIKQRTLDPKHKAYPLYGGRGIDMDPRWETSLATFCKEVGEPPVGHQLDRIDNDRGYWPDNVRWVTSTQNRWNAGKPLPKTAYSPYKGVTWHRKCQKWQAGIMRNGRWSYLGLFPTEESAALAYNEAAKERGEYSHLNKVQGNEP